MFAAVSGDVYPAHVDALPAKSTGLHGIIAVPIVPASRADTAHSRIASCAIALPWHNLPRRGAEALAVARADA